MADEVIQIDSDTIDQKIKEERKANGRLIAVMVAIFLLFLAIYHAWIRKIAVLAGILIPALIMILYGGWVVFLAKRDKQRRLLMVRRLEENARRELSESKSTISSKNNVEAVTKPQSVPTSSSSSALKDSSLLKNTTVTDSSIQINKKKHKKRRKHNKKNIVARTSSRISKKWRDKKQSFRHRLFFRQDAQTEVLVKQNQQKISRPLCRTTSVPVCAYATRKMQVRSFRNMGCNDENKCATAARAFKNIKDEKLCEDIVPIYDSNLGIFYFYCEQSNESIDYYVPTLSTNNINLIEIEALQTKFQNKDKKCSFYLTIVDPDSTVLYYNIQQGFT